MESLEFQIQYLILGTTLPTSKFTYLNNNGNNPKKRIKAEEMENVLAFDQILKLTNPENFYDILNKFENIYFVHNESNYPNLTAKKVRFVRVHGL